jgi:DNA (cytosine-5)-methyltransferase 1
VSNDKITFIDFCSGIGAGRLGLEQHNFKCLGFSEINLKSEKTYRSFFSENEVNFGDLTKIDYKKLPNFDLLIAGFPCQSFSINGKRKAFDDERGQIIFSLAKILKDKNIKYFILENVKGLVNINKGQTLDYILHLLDNSGYEVKYKILNTLNYGLPQSRERIYFVGIEKKLKNKNFEFPQPTKYKYDLSNFFVEDDDRYIIKENSLRWNTLLKQFNNKYNYGKYNVGELLKKDYLVIDTRQSDIRLYENYIPTLRTGRAGICYVKSGTIRMLSGKESLLFQGFSVDFYNKIKNITDTVLLEQTGNAMSINVISAIAENLKKVIGSDYGF